jgi:hypothetical protein
MVVLQTRFGTTMLTNVNSADCSKRTHTKRKSPMETQFSQALKWLPNVIALIAACYGIAFQQSILQSSRPLLPTNLETKSSLRAYARLWDDPFVVFPQDQNPPNIGCTRSLGDDSPTLLAFVLLGGLSYAEDDELRLRSRFAVQKALADLDYVPENPEVLENLPYPNYLRRESDGGQIRNGAQTTSTSEASIFLRRTSYRSDVSHHRNPIETSEESPGTGRENSETDRNPGIPFQDFQLRAINRFADTNHRLEKALPAGSRLQFGRIRVFWLDENVLSEKTLANLPSELAGNKRDFADPKRTNPLSIVVFGPSNSASLTQMVSLQTDQDQKSTWAPSTEAYDSNSDVRVINYQATAANDYIKLFAYQQKWLKEIYDKPIEASLDKIRPELEQPLLSLGPNNPLRIERTGCSDYQLCEALLGEVRRRTPFFVQRRPKILVFYETDTFYGRALALTLETLAKFPDPAHPPGQSEQLMARLFSKTDKSAPFRVEMTGYFRGLDGFSSYYRKQYVSAQSGSSDDAKGQSAEAGTRNKPVGLDHGEGSSQFDYIRRICNLIDRNDPPYAIALFGTDIFDKLSLLSILHEKLPDALYLSTELDSRYLAPENLAFTRNLIVVSPFGLSPMDENGRKPARSVSFRDSNQTALYKAVQCAVLGTDTPQTGPDLYEIGNLHAVPMATTNAGESAIETRHESLLDGTNPGPSMWLQALVIGSGILFLLFAIRPAILRARDFPKELAEPLKEALKTPDLRELAGALCDLKGAFECRWSEIDGVDGEMPALDRIGSARSRIKEDALKSFVEREMKQLADRLRRIAARKPSSLRIRAFPAIASEDITRTHSPQSLFWTAILSAANRLQIGSEKRVFEKFRRNLEDVLLNEKYVDAASFPELDSLNCYRRLPGPKVVLLELLGVTVATILFFVACRRLAPYSWGLVGFELRDSFGQYCRALLGFTEVWLTVWITLIVCREQFVCETLIRKFAKFINKASGLTSRRTILVIALRSDPVSKLSLYPCSLLFLLFVAHMKSLQGAPTTVAHVIAALFLLLSLFAMSNQVRMAANDARNRCLTEYKIDSLKAERARATLASVFGDEHLPLQDSLARVIEDVNQLGQKNSLGSTKLTLPGRSQNFVLSEVDLRTSVSRESIMRYLEALIERNRHVVDFISNLESGALTSLILSPLIAALLIPIGGAGGLTVLDYVAKLFRA